MATTPSFLKFPSDLVLDNTTSEPDVNKSASNKLNFIKFTFYERTKTSPNVVDNPVGNILKKTRIKPDIFLPLISNIFREATSTTYTNEELGPLGKLLYDKSAEAASSPGAIANVMKEAVSIDSATNILATLGSTVATTSDTEAVRSAVYAAGYAYNPNITMFFNGSQQNYRFFHLGWTLYPRNQEEAESLLQIEKIFLKNALPSTVNKNITDNYNYLNHYKYPYEVLMSLYIDGKPFHKFQFMPAYILYVDISHHDNQRQNEMSFMKKNDTSRLQYTGTTISLGVQEKEVFVRQYVDLLKPLETPVP